MILYHYLVLFVHGPELLGSDSPAGLEYAVEIRKIVEAAFETYLRYVRGSVHQLACGKAEPDVQDIVGKGLARPEFEETAERCGCHSDHRCHIFKSERLLIVVVYELLDLLHAAALGIPLRV